MKCEYCCCTIKVLCCCTDEKTKKKVECVVTIVIRVLLFLAIIGLVSAIYFGLRDIDMDLV